MATNFSSLHVFAQLWAVPCAVELLKKKKKANKLGVHEKGINSVQIRNKFMHLYLHAILLDYSIAFLSSLLFHPSACLFCQLGFCLFLCNTFLLRVLFLYFTQDFAECLGCKRTFLKTDIAMSNIFVFLRAY